MSTSRKPGPIEAGEDHPPRHRDKIHKQQEKILKGKGPNFPHLPPSYFTIAALFGRITASGWVVSI